METVTKNMALQDGKVQFSGCQKLASFQSLVGNQMRRPGSEIWGVLGRAAGWLGPILPFSTEQAFLPL